MPCGTWIAPESASQLRCPSQGPEDGSERGTDPRCCRRYPRIALYEDRPLAQFPHTAASSPCASLTKCAIEWRRAQDSNLQRPCGPVDFKSTALPVEASPPCALGSHSAGACSRIGAHRLQQGLTQRHAGAELPREVGVGRAEVIEHLGLRDLVELIAV